MLKIQKRGSNLEVMSLGASSVVFSLLALIIFTQMDCSITTALAGALSLILGGFVLAILALFFA
jgi:hypothetical protein